MWDCERLCVTQGGFGRCVGGFLAVSEEIVPAGVVLGGCPVLAPTSRAVFGATGEACEPRDTPFVDVRGLGGGRVRNEVTVSRKTIAFSLVCDNTFRQSGGRRSGKESKALDSLDSVGGPMNRGAG